MRICNITRIKYERKAVFSFDLFNLEGSAIDPEKGGGRVEILLKGTVSLD
jgi:hypothetical protein